MYLEKLIIKKKNEEIRSIKFKMGLNLIVDKTSNDEKDSGNNVGKTTFLKIIDFCLGGNAKAIYQDREFKRNNDKVLDWLKEDVTFHLHLKSDANIPHEIVRSVSGKPSIDGIEILSKDFENEIKKLLFGLTAGRPTLSQLMNKFIRIESDQLTNTLYFLFLNDNSEYEAIFLFLFGFQDTNLLSKKRNHITKLKAIEAKQKGTKLTTEELEQQLYLIDDEITYLLKQKDELNFKESSSDDIKKLKEIQTEAASCKLELSKLNLKLSLNQDTVKYLYESKANINVAAIRSIYDQAKIELPTLNKKFEDVLTFHNEMLKNKIEFINISLENTQAGINKIETKLNILLEDESKIVKQMSSEGTLKEYDSITIKLNDKYRQKGMREGLLENKREINRDLILHRNSISEINQDLQKFEPVLRENIKEFNKIFSDFSDKLYGEKYFLTPKIVENDHSRSILLDIGNLKENVGTGKKKAQISAFDLAYLKYSEGHKKIPKFILHDQLEVVFENQIETLFNISNSLKGQFVVAVLSDKLKKIPEDTIIENSILTLSQSEKLFKIP